MPASPPTEPVEPVLVERHPWDVEIWRRRASATALAQMVQLVRQGSLFTSSNGDRSLDTNT